MVTDKGWVGRTLHLLEWMVPGGLALFGLDDLSLGTVPRADAVKGTSGLEPRV